MHGQNKRFTCPPQALKIRVIDDTTIAMKLLMLLGSRDVHMLNKKCINILYHIHRSAEPSQMKSLTTQSRETEGDHCKRIFPMIIDNLG